MVRAESCSLRLSPFTETWGLTVLIGFPKLHLDLGCITAPSRLNNPATPNQSRNIPVYVSRVALEKKGVPPKVSLGRCRGPRTGNVGQADRNSTLGCISHEAYVPLRLRDSSTVVDSRRLDGLGWSLILWRKVRNRSAVNRLVAGEWLPGLGRVGEILNCMSIIPRSPLRNMPETGSP
jgi:hypothetical protein